MLRRALKKKLSKELVKTPFEEIPSLLLGYPCNSLLNPLFSFICSGDKVLRWRAISAFGEVLAHMTTEDIEPARIVMRRFLWSLNDESGGIGWGAPEAMAEAMVRSDILRKEYLHMLLSYIKEDGEELFQDGNHLELPMLQQGVLWGIARISEIYPSEMREQDIVHDLVAYLQSEDTEVIFHALRALSFLKPLNSPALVLKRELPPSFEIYKEGFFTQVTTAEVLGELSLV